MKRIAPVIALVTVTLAPAVGLAAPARTLASPKASSDYLARSASMKRTHPAAHWHSITVSPRTNLPPIRLIDKLNPVWWFGNINEPTPPDWYRPEDKHRTAKYRMRNPGHNFTFYVIGIADKKFVRSGFYPDRISPPHGGWNFAVSRHKIVPLPFISYRHGRFGFYFGWRNRGNFGVKLSFSTPRDPAAAAPSPQPAPEPAPRPRTPARSPKDAGSR